MSGATSSEMVRGTETAVLTAELGPSFDALPEVPPTVAAGEERAAQPGVAARVVGGTSALGLGVLIERGTGFAANILAARLGGPATFGAYSLALSTASQISTYAAGGIGATATRFSGKYPYGSAGYGRLARALALVSAASALLAGVALVAGAGPIAALLGKAGLAPMLRWAACSAAGMIVLECARGFFVGQRRLRALLLLSVLVGAGLLLLLPVAARGHQPIHMVVLQGAITAGAVLICLLLWRPLGLAAPSTENSVPAAPLGSMLREVWGFGLVQLAGLAGSNLAGWWLLTLVARTDTSLLQMSFFAIASQLRNLAGIVPGLLTEGSYAVMAEPEHAEPETDALSVPLRVMAACSFLSLLVSFSLAAIGIAAVPLVLRLLYGATYAPASLAVSLGLAVAVVHMGNAPAAARLSIVSIRSTGVINTVWAAFVAAAATLFLLFGGGAAAAMLIYFAAHVLSAALVLIALKKRDVLPAGMGMLFAVSTGGVTLLGLLATLRALHPALSLYLTGAMTLVAAGSAGLLLQLGRRHRWMPSRAVLAAGLQKLRGMFGASRSGVAHV